MSCAYVNFSREIPSLKVARIQFEWKYFAIIGQQVCVGHAANLYIGFIIIIHFKTLQPPIYDKTTQQYIMMSETENSDYYILSMHTKNVFFNDYA